MQVKISDDFKKDLLKEFNVRGTFLTEMEQQARLPHFQKPDKFGNLNFRLWLTDSLLKSEKS